MTIKETPSIIGCISTGQDKGTQRTNDRYNRICTAIEFVALLKLLIFIAHFQDINAIPIDSNAPA